MLCFLNLFFLSNMPVLVSRSMSKRVGFGSGLNRTIPFVAYMGIINFWIIYPHGMTIKNICG